MTIIDKKGKLFGLINLIDFCIICFLLIIAAAIVQRTITSQNITEKTEKVELHNMEFYLCYFRIISGGIR